MNRKAELREKIRQVANNKRRNRNTILVEGAEEAMDALKFEMAHELGLIERIQQVGYENMTTKECGSIGGLMTKRMIQFAQQRMKEDMDQSGRISKQMHDRDFQDWDYDAEAETTAGLH